MEAGHLKLNFKKITPQGVIFISECVPDSLKKRIWITSAYANKNGSKGQLLNLNPKDSSNLTPEASFDGNATKDRIAQNKPKVNSKSKKSSDERLALPEDGKKKKKYHMSHGQLRADVANRLFLSWTANLRICAPMSARRWRSALSDRSCRRLRSADKEHNIKRRQGTTIPCLFCR